jgi:dolichyl-phosphate beta-glucosyltransferase
MIDSAINYFNKDKKINFEIIIINDGSKDNTWGVIQDLITKRYPNVEISGVNYKKNSGKGFAVTTGMKYARGEYILMLDADGATKIQDYEKLRVQMDKIRNDEDNGAIVVGSRNHLVEDVVAKVIFNFKFYKNFIFLESLV